MFHVISGGGLVVMCMADKDFGHRIPYSFMNEVKEKFLSQNPTWQTARELQYGDFSKELGRLIVKLDQKS